MTKPDRILIPTNFSPSTKKACEFASMMASNKNLLIDLIHVVHRSSYFDDLFQKDNEYPDLQHDFYPELTRKAELELQKEMDQYIPEQYRGDYFLETDSNPSQVIKDRAREGGYSMIVMTSGEIGSEGMFDSSITEQVLRKSKVSMTILDDRSDIDNIKSILVPTDGSLLSMAAFPEALNVAKLLDGRITMLYIDEAYGLLSNHFSTKPSKSVKSEIIQFLLNRLREFFETIDTTTYELQTEDSFRDPIINIGNGGHYTIPLRVKIVTGLSAHHEITKYANRYSDIVVMTTHGRSGLAQFILGSTTEKVAQNIEKSLLTIRPEPELFGKDVREVKSPRKEFGAAKYTQEK